MSFSWSAGIGEEAESEHHVRCVHLLAMYLKTLITDNGEGKRILISTSAVSATQMDPLVSLAYDFFESWTTKIPSNLLAHPRYSLPTSSFNAINGNTNWLLPVMVTASMWVKESSKIPPIERQRFVNIFGRICDCIPSISDHSVSSIEAVLSFLLESLNDSSANQTSLISVGLDMWNHIATALRACMIKLTGVPRTSSEVDNVSFFSPKFSCYSPADRWTRRC